MVAVSAAVESAEMVGADRLCVLVIADHIRPDFIDIGLLTVVVHIRSVAAGGAHIDFQPQHIALPAQPFLILCQHKEFQVDEPASDAEGLDGPQARGADIVRHILHKIIHGVGIVIDNIHNGFR